MSHAAGTSAPPLKVGWLRKQARTGLIKNWQVRYVVLSDGWLKYYENQHDEPPYGDKLKGSMSLVQAQPLIERKKNGDRFIQIVGGKAGENDMLLEAETAAQAMEWVEAIRLHCTYASQPGYDPGDAEMRLSTGRGGSNRPSASSVDDGFGNRSGAPLGSLARTNSNQSVSRTGGASPSSSPSSQPYPTSATNTAAAGIDTGTGTGNGHETHDSSSGPPVRRLSVEQAKRSASINATSYIKVLPTPGFVIKVLRSQGVREKIFINLCMHNEVPYSAPPIGYSKWPFMILTPARTLNAGGGGGGDDGAEQTVYDAVVNNAAVALCNKDTAAKDAACLRVLRLLKKNFGEQLETEYKLPKIVKKYKGQVQEVRIPVEPLPVPSSDPGTGSTGGPPAAMKRASLTISAVRAFTSAGKSKAGGTAGADTGTETGTPGAVGTGTGTGTTVGDVATTTSEDRQSNNPSDPTNASSRGSDGNSLSTASAKTGKFKSLASRALSNNRASTTAGADAGNYSATAGHRSITPPPRLSGGQGHGNSGIGSGSDGGALGLHQQLQQPKQPKKSSILQQRQNNTAAGQPSLSKVFPPSDSSGPDSVFERTNSYTPPSGAANAATAGLGGVTGGDDKKRFSARRGSGVGGGGATMGAALFAAKLKKSAENTKKELSATASFSGATSSAGGKLSPLQRRNTDGGTTRDLSDKTLRQFIPYQIVRLNGTIAKQWPENDAPGKVLARNARVYARGRLVKPDGAVWINTTSGWILERVIGQSVSRVLEPARDGQPLGIKICATQFENAHVAKTALADAAAAGKPDTYKNPHRRASASGGGGWFSWMHSSSAPDLESFHLRFTIDVLYHHNSVLKISRSYSELLDLHKTLLSSTDKSIVARTKAAGQFPQVADGDEMLVEDIHLVLELVDNIEKWVNKLLSGLHVEKSRSNALLNFFTPGDRDFMLMETELMAEGGMHGNHKNNNNDAEQDTQQQMSTITEGQ